MRVFTASLATETNTFSPIPTDLAAFKESFYAPPGEHPATPTLCSAPMVVARRRAREEGFTLIEGTATWAEPAPWHCSQPTFHSVPGCLVSMLKFTEWQPSHSGAVGREELSPLGSG